MAAVQRPVVVVTSIVSSRIDPPSRSGDTGSISEAAKEIVGIAKDLVSSVARRPFGSSD